MRHTLLIALCGVCALLASCASERLRGQSGARPGWVRSVPGQTEEALPAPEERPAAQDFVYAVGQALGDNVLDEASMRQRAMADARGQLAARLETRLESAAREVVHRRRSGPPGSGEVADDEYYRELRTSARERLRGVRQQDTYWEKWQVDPGLFRRSFTRYKYYVLASYPREEYERIFRTYTRLTEDREKARHLLQEDRPAEAAALLEGLLDEVRDPPVAVVLMLSRAHERAGRLSRAEGVLAAALERAEAESAIGRLEGRLDRVRETFPDLTGRRVFLIVKGASVDPAWAEAPCSRSNVRVARTGRGETDVTRAVREGGAAGVDWVLEVEVVPEGAPEVSLHHGVELHKMRVSCAARLLGAEDGATVAAASVSVRAVERSRDRAWKQAARQAVHRAVREVFVTAAEREER